MNTTIMVEEGEEEVDLEQLKTLMTIVPIIVPILFTFVIVIGFVGNLLVVLVVLLNKTMRNTTNILIFNLAVSRKQFRYVIDRCGFVVYDVKRHHRCM